MFIIWISMRCGDCRELWVLHLWPLHIIRLIDIVLIRVDSKWCRRLHASHSHFHSLKQSIDVWIIMEGCVRFRPVDKFSWNFLFLGSGHWNLCIRYFLHRKRYQTGRAYVNFVRKLIEAFPLASFKPILNHRIQITVDFVYVHESNTFEMIFLARTHFWCDCWDEPFVYLLEWFIWNFWLEREEIRWEVFFYSFKTGN